MREVFFVSKHQNSVYRSIYADIAEKISSGMLAAGEKLSPERVLMEEYHVERTTIRRALEILENEGLIVKRAGLGSFVRTSQEQEVKVENAKAVMPEAVPATKKTKRTALPAGVAVMKDYAGAAEEIYAHLAAVGHERIAFIGCEAEIYAAFFAEAARVGSVDTGLFVLCESPYDIDYAFDKMVRGSRNARPTALVVSNETEAASALKSAKRQGFRVPEDLSVIAVEVSGKDETLGGSVFDVENTEKALLLAFSDLPDAEIPKGKFLVPAVVSGRKTVDAAPELSRGRTISDYLL